MDVCGDVQELRDAGGYFERPRDTKTAGLSNCTYVYRARRMPPISISFNKFLPLAIALARG
jgi:hypothetical protein